MLSPRQNGCSPRDRPRFAVKEVPLVSDLVRFALARLPVIERMFCEEGMRVGGSF